MPPPSALSPRQRVIDAAMACFARSGFHGASMQEICAEAGMSPGALYRYFSSKVSIIAAIAEAEREEHAAFFDRMADADDPVQALTSIGIDTLEGVLAGPKAALAAETVAEAIRNPDVRATFRRNVDEAQATTVEALKRGQQTGSVDPTLDTEAAAQLIMALSDGLATHQALDPAVTTARLRPTLELLVRRFLRPAAAALLLFTLPARAALAPDLPQPPAVTVSTAVLGSLTETIALTGTLVPREEVVVSPQIEGLAITSILVEEGDMVKSGQVMARLSHDLLDATLAQNAASIARAQGSVEQARAAIEESQANRTQADLAFNRTRDLASNGNASREALEQRQAASLTAAARLNSMNDQLRVAQADLALAAAQRQELLVRLDRTEIKAPVAGLVSRRTARLGAVVQGTGDPLFRIIWDDAIELEADVPETLLAQLRPEQTAEIATVNGPRMGKVRLVSPEVSRVTRLGRVRVAVTGEGPLVIGSFARASVAVAKHDGVLAPLSAVLFEPGGAIVQVVKDGVVQTRQVQVGLRAGGQAEITSGLQAGEAVVAISGTFVRGGDRVTAVPGS